MRHGIVFSPGDILVVDVAFTDDSGSKQRPVLVLSMPNARGDLVVVPISSQPGNENSVPLTQSQMTKGTLSKPSWVRGNRPLTVNTKTVVKSVGTAHANVLVATLKILCPHIGCK